MARARRLACIVASLTTAGCLAATWPAGRTSAAGAPAATAITLVASPPAAIGSSLTLTATVTGSVGSSPTGAVDFLDDGSPMSCGGGDAVTLASGATATATCTVTTLGGPAGAQSLTALYLGDASNLPGSASLEVPVEATPTTTALSAPAVAPGAPVTYAATVVTTAGPVTEGTVVFSDDGAPIGPCGGSSGVAVSGGSATCTVTSGYPTAGDALVEAAFTGTSSLGPSMSSSVEAIGSPPAGTATSTVLVASSLAPNPGAAIAVGAIVTGTAAPAGPPSGTVTFTDDGVALPGCAGVAVSAASGTDQGGATCDVNGALPSPVAQVLQALYTPAATSGFSPSISPASLVQPRARTAAVTLAASPDPAPGGQPVTLTAVATADATGSPAAGEVQFDVGGSPAPCTQPSATGGLVAVDATGTATCTVSSPVPGSTLAAVSYLGAAGLQPASAVAPLTVEAPLAPSAVDVAASADPVGVNQSVTYTATLTGGSTAPGGQVDFTAGASPINGCTAVPPSGGVATCTVATGYASTGTVVVTATYGGDATHLPGEGQMTETIGSSALTEAMMRVTSSTDPVGSGQPVTYTAVVQATTGAPSGSVAFADDGATIASCSAVALAPSTSTTSVAICTLTSGYTTDLTHVVTASFAGGSGLTSAGAALAEEVSPAQPTFLASTSPAPAVEGAPLVAVAQLDGAAGPPSGTVSFEGDGTAAASCGTVTLVSGGATCTLASPAGPGAAGFESTYSGDTFYAPSVAALGDEASTTGSARATVDVSATTRATAGVDVQVSVSVSGADATPTGSVVLTDGGTPLSGCGTNGTVALTAGAATCDVGTALATGVHDLTASYSGDATYAPASSLVTEPIAATASTTGSGGGTTGSGGGVDPSWPTSSGNAGGPASGTGSTGGGSPGSGSAGLGGGTGGGAGGEDGSAGGKGAPATDLPAAGGASEDGKRGGQRSGTRTPRNPSLTLSAPVAYPHRKVEFRVHVRGTRGPVGGTVTFSIDGRRIEGCTRVALGSASSLEVTCALAGGFSAAGNQVVTVTYSGSRRYEATRATAVEHVIPPWSGFWLVSSAGRLTAHGAAPAFVGTVHRRTPVAAAMAPNAEGLWTLARDGAVATFGTTPSFGSAPADRGPYTAIAPTRDGRGYWILGRSGAVLCFGDAHHLGSARATSQTGPYVAIATTPGGRGYWLLSARGTVVARGDARLYPRRHLAPADSGPFVAIAASGDGRGYVVLSRAGDLVAFGDASPVPAAVGDAVGGFIGILPTADHRGYWLAGRDGAVVPLGDARRLASRTSNVPSVTSAIAGT